jgi:UDP-N-acetyl-D-mannosaminuronate dehydrogenase
MKSLNFPARFIELATEINAQMPRHVARLAADLLNEDRLAVNGAKILIVGIAYKPDVSDVRESPALDVITLLLAKGAEVVYHDPYIAEIDVSGTAMKSRELSDDTLRGADLAIVITHHTSIDWERVVALSERVLDTRNATRDIRSGREKVRKL